ncbi:MAG: hypothetical protein WCO07_01075 [bacterium]
MKKDLLNLIKIIALGIVFSVGVGYLFAWQTMPNTPPNENIPLLLNTSAENQVKGSGANYDALLSIFGNLSSDSLVVMGDTAFTGNLTLSNISASPGSICANDAGELIKCDGASVVPVVPGGVTTNAITDIGQTGAISGGKIDTSIGTPITERGVAWGKTANPSISGTHSDDNKGLGSFTSAITGLDPGTLYHVRAYAMNSVSPNGTYGNEVDFTTSPAVYTLTVTRSGTGFGTVTSNLGGISCGPSGSICVRSYTNGSSVTLTKTAASGSLFEKWSGACSGNGTCSILMDSNKIVDASFFTCAGAMKTTQGGITYCWYQHPLKGQTCDTFCSNNDHGTCVDALLNYTDQSEVCTAVSLGSAGGGNYSSTPRGTGGNCYVHGLPSNPTSVYNSGTCYGANSAHYNACSCSQ